MAGHVPAIRTAAVVIGLAGFVASSPAASQTDSASPDQLRTLHSSLVTAEENLAVALRDRDFARANSANETLFKLLSSARQRRFPASSCLEALEGLGGVAVAVAFAVHPVTTGDPGSMNKEELRFSAQMRPAPEVLEKWYTDYSATYRTKMPACEQEAAAGPSPRSLPTQFTQK
jgi:hypothetical protein